jgi:hypothetical protein
MGVKLLYYLFVIFKIDFKMHPLKSLNMIISDQVLMNFIKKTLAYNFMKDNKNYIDIDKTELKKNRALFRIYNNNKLDNLIRNFFLYLLYEQEEPLLMWCNKYYYLINWIEISKYPNLPICLIKQYFDKMNINYICEYNTKITLQFIKDYPYFDNKNKYLTKNKYNKNIKSYYKKKLIKKWSEKIFIYIINKFPIP